MDLSKEHTGKESTNRFLEETGIFCTSNLPNLGRPFYPTKSKLEALAALVTS